MSNQWVPSCLVCTIVEYFFNFYFLNSSDQIYNETLFFHFDKNCNYFWFWQAFSSGKLLILNSCTTYFEVCYQRIVLVSLLKITISQEYSTVKMTAQKAIFRFTCYHIIHNKYRKILSELNNFSSETF